MKENIDTFKKHDLKGQLICGVKIEDLVISSTGSSRSDRTGKGRFDLIPADFLRRVALRFEGGAVAHGDRNWEKGMSVSRCYNSALGHLLEWSEGADDEDHLAAASWNIAAIMFMEKNKPEHMDLPGLSSRREKSLE